MSKYLTDEYTEAVDRWQASDASVYLFSTDPFDVHIIMDGNTVLSCRVKCNNSVEVIQYMIEQQLGE